MHLAVGHVDAHPQVFIYWAEAEVNGRTSNVEPLTPVLFMYARGTNQPEPRCRALTRVKIGKELGCSIICIA